MNLYDLGDCVIDKDEIAGLEEIESEMGAKNTKIVFKGGGFVISCHSLKLCCDTMRLKVQ